MTKYIPYITTPAACLTRDNWRELGIDSGVAVLSQLLIKPGLAFWQQKISLAQYLAWDTTLILDASDMALTPQSEFVIRSPYDGSRYSLSIDGFWEVVQRLNPAILLLPQGMSERPCGQVRCYHRGTELREGVYIEAQEGWLFLDGMQTLYASDQPARDAVQGSVYTTQGAPFSILDATYAMDFQILSPNCTCPTCQQGFTRAYLHHLLQTTPLLCHRLLLMHNVTQSYWTAKH